MALPTHEATVRRRARILILLNAAAEAGLAPISVIPLHALAYLANVLAPVWKMPALNGRILKRKGGPFYPDLQHDIDRMVGAGMVVVRGVHHVRDSAGKWRVEGMYGLNRELTRPAVEYLLGLHDENRVASFVQELAFALSALGESEFKRALIEDATYSDPTFSEDNVPTSTSGRRGTPASMRRHILTASCQREHGRQPASACIYTFAIFTGGFVPTGEETACRFEVAGLQKSCSPRFTTHRGPEPTTILTP